MQSFRRARGVGPRVGATAEGILDGAEAAVKITSDKRGSAWSFASETEARDYADELAKSGDKTTIVGTVVFQAASQEDADFFAGAYEG